MMGKGGRVLFSSPELQQTLPAGMQMSLINPALTTLLVSFVNMSQTRVTCEEGSSVVELPLSDWPMGMSAGHFLGC